MSTSFIELKITTLIGFLVQVTIILIFANSYAATVNNPLESGNYIAGKLGVSFSARLSPQELSSASNEQPRVSSVYSSILQSLDAKSSSTNNATNSQNTLPIPVKTVGLEDAETKIKNVTFPLQNNMNNSKPSVSTTFHLGYTNNAHINDLIHSDCNDTKEFVIQKNFFDNNNKNSSTKLTNDNQLKRFKKHSLLFQDSDCEQTSKRPVIYGIRCDDEHETNEDGSIIIKSGHDISIFMFGINLYSNLSIALTTSEGSAQDDCTHTNRVKTLEIENASSTNIIKLIVNMPATKDVTSYYICIRESNDNAGWYHQGSNPWLKINIQTDLLPLYMKIIVIACLLMLSGLFSGLNLGLMSLDKNELQVIMRQGNEREKRYARAIDPVRRRGNYLLCSILFSNVLVNSTIAVLLEELTSGIVAVMTSTIFIVMFGEILPQAFCSRHGLAVGAKTVGLTYLCMILTWPLSYPVSRCLDWALGEEIGHVYDRDRLMEFIRITQEFTELKPEEVNIISGAMQLKHVPISNIMTKIEDVYMLDLNSCLDFDTIQAIIEKGYSRIPVHEPGDKKNIVALLFAKDLALLDPDDKTPVQTMISFYNHPIMYVFEDTTLDIALNEFKTGKSHMAIVQKIIDDGEKDPVYEITGIVTLEDVIEEIMQMEINDETDTLSDNRRKRRRKEAQVRKDFSHFTNLGAGDSSFNVVTPQLCLAAYQYLATTVEPFTPKYLSDSILKRLLSQKIYYKVRMDDTQAQKRLYTVGEPSDYFVMILEGRVHVVCGRENLVFDGGPFSFFGKAALTASDSFIVNDFATAPASSLNAQPISRKESSISKPMLSRRESIVEKLGGHLSISMKKLEQVVADSDNANTINIPVTPPNPSTSAINWLKSGESRTSVYSIGQVDKLATHYIPDYTVDIVTNTSYVKVTRSEYLTALKATLVERGNSTQTDVETSNSSFGNIAGDKTNPDGQTCEYNNDG